MKPTIHPQRPSRAIDILRSLVLVAFGLLAGNSARATTTYSYSGSHSLTWTTNSWKYIDVSRTGGADSLTVFASLTGSSNFSLDNASVFWADSSADSTGQYGQTLYFAVNFSSLNNDTSYAKLVLQDKNHSDTITLVGIGTFDSVDFTVGATVLNIVTGDDSGRTLNSTQDEVLNHRSTGITVVPTFLDSTYWSINIDSAGATTIVLPGNGWNEPTIIYTPHGVWHDTGTLYFTCTSPYHEQKVVHIYVTDPDYAPQTYAPTVTAPYLGTVANDSTGCGTITITDSTSQDITITRISAQSQQGWSYSGMPSLPLTLSPGGSTSFTVCISPGSYYYGSLVTDGIGVTYSDSDGITGTVYGYATAQTVSCIQAMNNDSSLPIQLDELMAGGNVVATATFVMHEDSLLSSSGGTVSPYGGTVQILSPSLPRYVSNGDTVTFTFRVTPNPNDDDSSGNGSYNYDGYTTLHLGACDANISFTGYITDSTNADLNLFQNETGLMALTSSGSTKVDTFWFDNNESGHVVVSNVALSQGTNFTILGELPHAPADTLSSGNSMGVIIRFDGDTNGFYHDSLSVTTEVSRTDGKHEIMSSPTTTHLFNLEAIRTQGTASVAAPVAISPANISIVPNPASGPVMISVNEAQKADIEIFDLLGNRIVNNAEIAGSAYEWNPNGMANGIYIIRASGVDANGTPFVISERMVLNK